MLNEKDITIRIASQGYICENYAVSLEGTESVMTFRSSRKTSEVRCPTCNGEVYINELACVTLTDMPIWYGRKQDLVCEMHRYQCRECNACFTEEVPFKYPGTRITKRAAEWIRQLLRAKLPIKAVSEISGVHWDTVHKIHKEMMEEAIKARSNELSESGYHPKMLAVDEFAIHKGHTYATCVMDLDTGEIIWVGKGRSKEDFEHFFIDISSTYLSEVKAVAMDMNASYNILFKEKLPQAEIVYDRYHMQAQYGKDVLGAVRLSEAKKHQEISKSKAEEARAADDMELRKALKEAAKEENKQYAVLKRLRWTLLTNGANLDDKRSEYLNTILEAHSDLSVCYALKEELCSLFELTDPTEAYSKWSHWFDSADVSGVEALENFSRLKRSRLDGLAAHAKFHISTGKLEGFNNKIKVAKRVGYGYRDDSYFFTLIRYLALPSHI